MDPMGLVANGMEAAEEKLNLAKKVTISTLTMKIPAMILEYIKNLMKMDPVMDQNKTSNFKEEQQMACLTLNRQIHEIV